MFKMIAVLIVDGDDNNSNKILERERYLDTIFQNGQHRLDQFLKLKGETAIISQKN
jgi:hypothetical protein